MKSLAKNSAVNLVYTVVDFVLLLVRAAYTGRILLADGVGQVSYVKSITEYFIVFAQLGLPAYGVREIARAREKGTETDKTFTELFVINFFSTTCALFAYFLLIFRISSVKEQLLLFFVFGLNVFSNYFNVEWFYQGKEEYVFIAVKGVAVKLLSVAAMFSLVRTSVDCVNYALICCLELCVNYVLNMLYLRKLVRPVRKGLVFKKHMKPMIILMVTALFTSMYSHIDVTMLGAMSSKTATGYYSYANMAILGLTTACIAVLSIFFPRLSYYYCKDIIRFHELLQLGLKAQMFIAVPISACVFILAPQIVMILLGNAFLPAVTTVRILSSLIVIQSFSHLIGYQVLMATGNEKEQIPAFIIAVLVNVILNAFFIPVWANNGAAIASVISEVVVCIYKTCKVYRRIPYKIPWKALVQALVSTVIMVVLMVVMIQVELLPLLQCIVAAAAGIGAYGLANLLMKNELMMKVLCRLKAWMK